MSKVIATPNTTPCKPNYRCFPDVSIVDHFVPAPMFTKLLLPFSEEENNRAFSNTDQHSLLCPLPRSFAQMNTCFLNLGSRKQTIPQVTKSHPQALRVAHWQCMISMHKTNQYWCNWVGVHLPFSSPIECPPVFEWCGVQPKPICSSTVVICWPVLSKVKV